MRKSIGLILVFLLLFGTLTPSFAVESESKGLEEAILKAKSILDIPEGLTEFDYSSSEDYGEEGSVTYWHLNWYNNDNNEYANLSAVIDSLGNLNSYYYYRNSERSGLAKVTREQGKSAADAFVSKALPDLYEDLRLVNEKENATSTYNLRYTYRWYKDDIPVPFVEVAVTVDKYSGEVAEYYGLVQGYRMPEFEVVEAGIGREAAAKAYQEKIGLTMKYRINFDYDQKTTDVFLTYETDGTSAKAIDARTGEAVDLYSGFSNYTMFSRGFGAMAESSADSGLSPAEQAAVETVSGLISSEEAADCLKEAAAAIDTGAQVTSSDLRQNYFEKDKFVWSISFDNAYGTVDAKTGEVLSFRLYDYNYGWNYYEYEEAEDSGLAREEAQAIAEEFLKEIAPSKFAQTKLSDETDEDYSYPASVRALRQNFWYFREANGLEVVGNGLSVTISEDGDVVQYSSTWYDSLSFPQVTGTISEESAFEAFDKAGNLFLSYALTDAETAALVYQFESEVAGVMIDPKTGVRIDRTGKEYKEDSLPEYTDLEGHWSEDVVQELLYNGYYLAGSEFKPDQDITQADFLRYIYGSWSAGDDDDFYDYLVRRGILKKGEGNPKAAITRQEAARFVIRYLGLEKAAEVKGIYAELFTDTAGEEYEGHAALCKGLGIMEEDSNGAFNGLSSMTRAEAANVIYRMLQI